MAKQKATEPELTAQQLLEARVDAMMDPRPKPVKGLAVVSEPKPSLQPPVKPDTVEPDTDLPPLDIFAATKGAPALPKDLVTKEDERSIDQPMPPIAKIKEPPVEQKTTAEPDTTVSAEADEVEPPVIIAPTTIDGEAEIDDAQSDAAIDDIVAQEGDEVLAAEDAGLAAAALASPELINVPSNTQKRHPIFWFIVLLVVILAGIAAYVLTSPGA